MGQELQIPESFKNFVPAKAFAALNALAADDNLAAGIGQSYPVIGYKGKVWSLRHRGERKNIVRPDDGTPASYLDVIILGQANTKSKSYYKKYDPNQSDGDRPICSSIDGVVPDLDVVAKQCDTCALCPKNVWKTDATTGRKGRECTDYKRIAILILPTQTKPLFGEPLLEPCFLRVPPASLNSLAIMGETMGAQGFHYSTYITRITFDPNVAHPQMVFRPLQGLTEQEAPVIMELRADPTVGRITGGEVTIRTVENSPAPVVSSGFALSQGASGLKPLDVAPPATPTPNVSTASPKPTMEQAGTPSQTVDTGFGTVNTASTAQTQSTPPLGDTQTAAAAPVADAGAPEEADGDLDARIAALINKQ